VIHSHFGQEWIIRREHAGDRKAAMAADAATMDKRRRRGARRGIDTYCVVRSAYSVFDVSCLGTKNDTTKATQYAPRNTKSAGSNHHHQEKSHVPSRSRSTTLYRS
jgi:hypothetical protein